MIRVRQFVPGSTLYGNDHARSARSRGEAENDPTQQNVGKLENVFTQGVTRGRRKNCKLTPCCVDENDFDRVGVKFRGETSAGANIIKTIIDKKTLKFFETTNLTVILNVW